LLLSQLLWFFSQPFHTWLPPQLSHHARSSVVTLSVDVDQDSAAQYGITVAQARSIVDKVVRALVALDLLVHRACAVQNMATVVQAQIIAAGVSRLLISYSVFDSGNDRWVKWAMDSDSFSSSSVSSTFTIVASELDGMYR
jgi:hypothetical protein